MPYAFARRRRREGNFTKSPLGFGATRRSSVTQPGVKRAGRKRVMSFFSVCLCFVSLLFLSLGRRKRQMRYFKAAQTFCVRTGSIYQIFAADFAELINRIRTQNAADLPKWRRSFVIGSTVGCERVIVRLLKSMKYLKPFYLSFSGENWSLRHVTTK